MAQEYLYQAIMKVPGLTGTWQQRNRQLYYQLGAPMGAYDAGGTQNNWLLNQIRNNNYYSGGVPGMTNQTTQQTNQTPQEQLLQGVTNQLNPNTQAFSDVVNQNTWNSMFDEWTRNFAKTYMEPEWQRNVYNPALKESGQTLESLNRQIGNASIGGLRSGAQVGTLDEAARTALKEEEDLRQQYQSNLAKTRQTILDQWATPLYESEMTNYMNTPWQNLNLGTTTTGANIDTAGLKAALESATGTNVDLENLMQNINLGDMSSNVPTGYDWTAPKASTNKYLQYLKGSNVSGGGKDLYSAYTPYV